MNEKASECDGGEDGLDHGYDEHEVGTWIVTMRDSIGGMGGDDPIEYEVEVRRSATSSWFVAELDIDAATALSPRAAVVAVVQKKLYCIEEVFEILAPGQRPRAEISRERDEARAEVERLRSAINEALLIARTALLIARTAPPPVHAAHWCLRLVETLHSALETDGAA